MREVFISYKSNDSQLGNNDETVANELCSSIEAAGLSCWIAPRDIEPGVRYGRAIMEAINSCQVMVVVFSKHANISEHIANEVDAIFARHVDIIPFNIDGSQPGLELDYYLRRMQWIDASGDYRKKIPELIKALQRKLGKTGTKISSSDDTFSEPNPNKELITNEQNSNLRCRWPSPESVEIEDVAIKDKEQKNVTVLEKIKGAAKGALLGYGVAGVNGALGGAIIGATKPIAFEIDDKDDQLSNVKFTVNGVSFNMIRVEGGTFMMGAIQKNDSFACDSGQRVGVSSFLIGETLVTQKLWQVVMGENPSCFNSDLRHPVEKVSWEDCQVFINKLNVLTGKKFRLPSEAEWEYAARGGKISKGYIYAGSNNLSDIAWHKENSDESTHPVSLKTANELGLYDMNGNVWEWCQDSSNEYRHIYSQSLFRAEKIYQQKMDNMRVCRGGSWRDNPKGHCFYIIDSRWEYPRYRFSNIGLRLAL